MNTKRFPIWEVVACLSTSIIAIVCVSRFIPDLKGEVAAAWVQAIGSIAAIGVAIWISYDQDIARRNESLRIAKITAAAITYKVAILSGELASYVQVLEKLKNGQGQFRDFEICLKGIESHFDFDLKDLTNLEPLGNDCAYKIAAGMDQVHSAHKLLKTISVALHCASDNEWCKQQALFPYGALIKARVLFTEAYQFMEKEINLMTSQQIIKSTIK